MMTRAMCYGAWPSKTRHRKDRLWREAENFIDDYPGFVDWDQTPWDGVYACDAFGEYFCDYGSSIWDEDEGYRDDPHLFYNQLRCALRAGLDAVSGECGIIGFTVGDVRHMFDGALPQWFANAYTDPKALIQAPDDAALWL